MNRIVNCDELLIWDHDDWWVPNSTDYGEHFFSYKE